jgi:hypothetical protein
VRRALGLIVALALWSAPLSAQDGGGGSAPRIDLPKPPQLLLSLGPLVSSGNLLHDGSTRELLRNGFPARLHYRLELWSESGWFDDMESATEWDVFVRFDPADEVYRVVRRHGRQLEDFGGFGTLTSAEEILSRPYTVPLRPRRKGGRYYYTLSIDVEAMSLSDLDELQRWLKGEFTPAVQGKNNPATALKNGIGTLLTRVLGGEKRHYVRRSETFRAPE